jgi:hypothetical protein
MEITRTLVIVAFCLGIPFASRGQIFHDPIHTALNIGQQVIGQGRQEVQHVENITKYTTMIQKQLQQIDQFTTIINQNVDQLKRFGNPDTYINMLGLDKLLNEVHKVQDDVSKTVSEFRKTADGIAALKNTGEGLYQDLSELPDKFGQRIQYEIDRFKKFGAVQDMDKDYNHQLTELNRSVTTLENETKSTVQQVNSAGSLVETEKFKAKLQAIQGTIDHHIQKAILAALKIVVQGEANRNDQARQQEVMWQRQAQETAADIQRLRNFGASILGLTQSN